MILICDELNLTNVKVINCYVADAPAIVPAFVSNLGQYKAR